MDPLLEGSEVEPIGAHDDQFAVQHHLVLTQLPEGRQQFWEVPGHRTLSSAHKLDAVAVAEHEGAESVPLGLVLPAVALGVAVTRRRQHRLHVQGYCNLQTAIFPPSVYISRIN